MAEYVSLFYTRSWQSYLPIEAPFLNLKNIKDLRELDNLLEKELNRNPDNEVTSLMQRR